MKVRRDSSQPKPRYEELEILEEMCLDVKNRVIYLVGDIDGSCVESIVQQLLYLSSSKHTDRYQEPIKIVINSLGGCDDMMLYLYDAMMNTSCRIVTVGSGLVCSAATLILVAGDDRYATENCMFMTHKGHAVLSGDEDEISAQAEFNRKVSDRYWKLLGRHTSLSGQRWYSKSKSEGEHWLDVKGMLETGVIDGVLEPTTRTLEPLPPRRIKTKIKHEEDDDD